MVYLLLGVFCSAMISIIMRLSSGKVSSHFSMLAVNYLICGLLGAFYADFSLLSVPSSGVFITLGLSLVYGILLLSGLMLLQRNTAKNGVVLSSLFMKLGLLVPFLVSILVFREIPTWLQISGFCVAAGAIVLFNLQKDTQLTRFDPGLILLLLVCGGGDAVVKIFESAGPAALSNHFLCLSFSVAFLLCASIVLFKRERPDLPAVFFGAAIGSVNFFSSKFLLATLTQLPAVVVFPTYSVATMLVVTLCGVLFFKEQLQKHQWIAFVAVIIALVLLNI